jgi:hypothetical protein
VDVPGRDGAHPPVTIVEKHEDPAFPQPPLSACGDVQLVGSTETQCQWEMACAGRSVTWDCYDPQVVGSLFCGCKIDGKDFQSADPPKRPGGCEAFTKDDSCSSAASRWIRESVRYWIVSFGSEIPQSGLYTVT